MARQTILIQSVTADHPEAPEDEYIISDPDNSATCETCSEEVAVRVEDDNGIAACMIHAFAPESYVSVVPREG